MLLTSLILTLVPPLLAPQEDAALAKIADDLLRARSPALYQAMVPAGGVHPSLPEIETRVVLTNAIQRGVALATSGQQASPLLPEDSAGLSPQAAQQLVDQCLLRADDAADQNIVYEALCLTLEVCRGLWHESMTPVRQEVLERLNDGFAGDSVRMGSVIARFFRDVPDEHAAENNNYLQEIQEWSPCRAVQAAAAYYRTVYPSLVRHRRQTLSEAETSAARRELVAFRDSFGGERHPSGLTYSQVIARDLAELDAAPKGSRHVPAPLTFQPLRNVIIERLHDGADASLAVAVIKDGRIVWAEGFGLADLERGRPATSDTIYILASVSKPVTATGLMILADRGLVDLEAPANRYLPRAKLNAYRGSAEDITVRRLANHTGGLPVHWNFFYNGVEPPPMDETIRRYGFAATLPGTEYNYSNLGFGILNYITEVVSGRPWREFMEAELYDPLGMTHTSDRVRPGKEDHAAVLYVKDTAGRFTTVHSYGFDHPGASTICTSVTDLARFALMHLNDGELEGTRLLSAEAAREMRVDRTGACRGNYGIGWATGREDGHPFIAHGGGMPGVATHLRIYPEAGAAFAILTNSSQGELPAMVGHGISSILRGTAAPPAPPAATDSPATDPAATASANTPKVAVELDGIWVGRMIHFDGDIPLEVEIQGVVIRVSSMRGPRVTLRDVRRQHNRIGGTIDGLRLRTQDSYHGSVTVAFDLRHEGDSLAGIAYAQADEYFNLPHWVELRRRTD
ncbi:MAG: serine hydrolase domain-containing protein [Planctomycetota bacterium]